MILEKKPQIYDENEFWETFQTKKFTFFSLFLITTVQEEARNLTTKLAEKLKNNWTLQKYNFFFRQK